MPPECKRLIDIKFPYMLPPLPPGLEWKLAGKWFPDDNADKLQGKDQEVHQALLLSPPKVTKGKYEDT